MISKNVFSLFCFFCLLFHTSKVAATCPISGCDITGPIIRFPFQLNSSVDNSCGYPRFGLSCSKTNQTIINLPGSGAFVVTYINYHLQYLYVNDPDNCLPKRLQNFTLDNTPFEFGYFKKFTLLNCSTSFLPQVIPQSRPFPCLDDVGVNRTVVSVPEDVYGYYAPPLCSSMSTIWAPVKDRNSVDINDDIMLRWRDPRCWRCEQRGGVCGLKDEKTLEIGCYNLPSNGDSKSAKYRIIIGILVPGCLCIALLICYYCSRARIYSQRHDVNIEISVWPSSVAQLPVLERGLDVQTLESYPKTQLGESKRLPNPGQNTCAICLSEYNPKETLKTLPECNHFFHAQCIDQWLKMNSTCPLCRNSPGRSSQGTPSSMFSFTSSSSSVSPI